MEKTKIPFTPEQFLSFISDMAHITTMVVLGGAIYALYHLLKLKYKFRDIDQDVEDDKVKREKARAIAEHEKRHFDITENGWVLVNEGALKYDTPVDPKLLAGVEIPVEAELLCYYLTAAQRYTTVARHVAEFAHNTAKEESRRRGMTIGSALFNYSIPLSLVLIDDTTKMWYALLMHQYDVRHEFREWAANYNHLFKKQHEIMAETERDLKVTGDMAVNFYHQHSSNIASAVIQFSGKTHLPPLKSLIYGITEQLKIEHNELNHHLVWVAITLVICNCYVRCPIGWIIYSPVMEYAFMVVNNLPPEPAEKSNAHGLRLVVNNSKFEEPKNVW